MRSKKHPSSIENGQAYHRLPAGYRYLAASLNTFFHLLYHQFAWTYDWVAAIVSLGRWKDWISATLPYLDGPLVLEIGHGPGHLQVALQAKGIQAVGLDASAQMGRQADRCRSAAGRCDSIQQSAPSRALAWPPGRASD